MRDHLGGLHLIFADLFTMAAVETLPSNPSPIAWAYVVMAYILMACVVMACVVMVHIVMACVVMVHIVMACP